MQVPDLPVYGVAIPTVSGLQRVLQTLGAEHGELGSVYLLVWQSLPIVFIFMAEGCRSIQVSAFQELVRSSESLLY